MNSVTVTSPPGNVPKRHRMTRNEWRNLRNGLLFISPWIIGFLAFLIYPIYYTVRISFTKYTGFGPAVWIGLDNYHRMLNDGTFWKALWNTIYYTGLAVPIGVVVAMGLALCMNQRLPEVPLYRAILFIPSIIPGFALSLIFLILMDPTQGIFNRIIGAFGLPTPNWFGDPAWVKATFVFLAQFGAGQVALIFLAALKAIPASLHEAAMMDGASAVNRFWNITVPLMTPVILYDLILGLSLGLQIFTQAYIITQGGPVDSSRFYVLYLYDNAFKYGQMGYASALSVVLFLITFVLAALIFWSSNRWVNYETM